MIAYSMELILMLQILMVVRRCYMLLDKVNNVLCHSYWTMVQTVKLGNYLLLV